MRYRLMERIGSGGMAEVFRATAEGAHGFARTFVIKRILPRLAASPEFLRMFVDEAKISARLAHPNIVQMFDFADQGGTPLLIMEYVDGRDLGAVLRKLADHRRAVPPAIAAEIARQCCLALEYAHRLTGADGAPLGIIHRDVTPSNIMISYDGVVKLLDFGIARAAQQVRSTETAAGTMKGKMGYVAPEQINGGDADHRADLFALGTVLHEALTGRRLFAGENDLATLKNVLEAPVSPPSKVSPAVSRTLDRIVMKALRRNPRDRYASAADMADDLDAYLRRRRPPVTALRAFMQELFEDDRRGAAQPDIDGTIVVDEVELLAGVERSPGAPAATPPPIPVALPRIPSGPTRVEPAPPRRGLLARRPRGAMLAAAAAALLVLVGGGLAVRPHLGPTPGVAGARPGETVEITLDSEPQGAQVSREPEGPPIGETPLVLELPRGRAPIAFWLHKDGYQAETFKLIPRHDHDAKVTLRRGGSDATKTASTAGETN